MKYPKTKKVKIVDHYFGTEIKDPYRWLEDDLSKETAKWVDEQNAFTQEYLNKIPFRKEIKNKISELMNFKKEFIPFKEGDYTYCFKNDGLQNQNILYRTNKKGQEEIFLDPNKFSEKGTDSLSLYKFSKDGSLFAYQISTNGSDWKRIIVLDTKTKKQVGETLTDIKFSNISWKDNEGFYYSTYKKITGSKMTAKTENHLVFYHKINTYQSKDEIVFGNASNEQYRYVYARITTDNKYLELSAANSSSNNSLFIKNLKEDANFKLINNQEENNSYILNSKNDKLYIFTNFHAPNNKLVVVDAENPNIENWKDLIPETENVLNIEIGGSYFFAQYIENVKSKILKYDYNGKLIHEIKLPQEGTVQHFFTKETEDIIYYYFTNNITPVSIYQYKINTNQISLYQKSNSKFNSSNFESKQIFYTSKDGTKIPMTISYKKGLKLDGKTQTILYGYGGFNTSLLPFFSPIRAAWLELGGIFAIANLRGGGEYGKTWHDAGIQLKKQNVFDDFIAAAEYLIKEKYTSSNFLAIQGGSNGGLLVGASMLQKPKLFKVALPAVGVLDMLRYHTFTAGAGWSYDYGTSEQSKEMFENILAYSPLHNIKTSENYPATFITTGDHDDRVVPAHSFKFAAELQRKQSGDNPILIRIEKNAGHGAGKPISKIINENADIYAFTLYNMKITLKINK